MTLFEQEIQNNKDVIASRLADSLLAMKASVYLANVDLSDVAYIIVLANSHEGEAITLHLKDNARDSHLVHKMAQMLGISFEKTKDIWSESLIATAKIEDITIRITGYVPATCQIVQTEEEISEEEYQRKIAQVSRKRIKTEIRCNEAAAAE